MVTHGSGERDDPRLSAIVLAGGLSRRMGTDKSLLRYRGVAFVTLISNEMMKVSDDVVLVIGEKDEQDYRDLVGSGARIARDAYDARTPLSGLATGFGLVRHPYSAAVGCDTPMLKHTLVQYLSERALGHSAAVPVWRNIGRFEPLVSVYNRDEAAAAALGAIRRGALDKHAWLSPECLAAYIMCV